MEQGLISVIIPVFNRSHFLGETLDSLRKQSYEKWECIVVDDRSTDHINYLMDFYSQLDERFTFVIRPEERIKGANSCRNYGFQLSKGEFIQWFDSDDLFEPDYFSEKIALLNSSEADLCLCDADFFLGNNRSIQSVFNNFPRSNILREYLTGRINMNTQVVLWKRHSVENHLFDETLFRAQELDFHFRLLKNKEIKAKYINRSLISIRGHSDSISGATKKGDLVHLLSELKVLRNILGFLKGSDYSVPDKNKCLKRYLDSFRILCQWHNIGRILKELNSLAPLLKDYSNYEVWLKEFIPFLFIYKLTGREFRLKKSLYQLNYER